MERANVAAAVRRVWPIAAAVIAAALVCAVLAHLAIDAIGDVALSDDSYDHVAHGSRAAVFTVVLCIAIPLVRVAWQTLFTAAQRARGTVHSSPRALHWLAAATAVVVLTFPLLIGMETADVHASGGDIDNLGDLLGGSLLLGSIVCGAVAIIVTAILACAARWVLLHRDAIVAVLARYQDCAQGPRRTRRARSSPAFLPWHYVARPDAGRAPPALASSQALFH